MDENKIVSVDALEDNRSQDQKDKDYSTEEVAGDGADTVFKHKRIDRVETFEFNQWYTGSCVPHGFLTQLEYEGISKAREVSRLRAYRKRSNYPQAGSIAVDMYKQIKSGQSVDFLTPEGFNDKDANAMFYVRGDNLIAQDFKYFQYINKATGDLLLNNVPHDVANGKAIAIFIYATIEEYSKEFVEVIDNDLKKHNATVRHCVCIVPNGDFTQDGKRWLTVQDSAKFGGLGVRHLEYDEFFLGRTYFASKVYVGDKLPKPDAVYESEATVTCRFGQKNSAVLSLQKFLVQAGKLKKEYQTGYYGALTAKAVLWWQLEYWELFSETNDTEIPDLLNYDGKYWGKASVSIIKNL